MRAILDSHPEVRCGTETKVVPGLLTWLTQWLKFWGTNPALIKEFQDTGLKNSTLNDAVRQFLRVVIENHGRQAKRYCTKDPYDAFFITYLKEIFPNMKFILLMRDVRGVSYSFVNRLKRHNISHYVGIFHDWNAKVKMFRQSCKAVGSNSCMIVYYEHLILNKMLTLKKLTEYLDIPWSESLLNHEKYIGDRVQISDSEWSTSQIKQATYTDSINAWAGQIPKKALRQLRMYAPMLKELGYDPSANNSYNRMPI